MTRPLANITREVLEPVWMRHDIPTEVIAARLGVTRQGLSYKARSLGLPSRAKNRRKHVDDETFTKMWLAGVSSTEMATAFGYPRQNFMHIDTGRPRRWGDPFPHREGRFSEEPPRLREKLADSRTMKGGGVAGASTVGAAGVEMAQQSLQDAQSSLQPLIPYLDTLRWAFIAAALAGVALTIYARWDDWRRGRR